MYPRNVYNVDSSYVQPGNNISRFHHQETNSSLASPNPSPTYNLRVPMLMQNQIQDGYPLLETSINRPEVSLPRPCSRPRSVSLKHPNVGSNVNDADLQIASHKRNADVSKYDSEDSSDQVRRIREITRFLVLGDNFVNMESTNEVEKDNQSTWLQRPSNFLTTASLWSLLWKYALRHFDGMVKKGYRKGKDYIDQIVPLINILNEEMEKPITYQILTASGIIWQEKAIRFEANFHIETDTNTLKTACVSILCKKCPFKVLSNKTEKLFEHIYQLTGVKYRCVYCGLIFNAKSALISHSKGSYENGGSQENQNNIHPSVCEAIYQTPNYKIRRIDDFENRFLEWIRKLIEDMKQDNRLLSRSTEMLIHQIKREMDFNFVDFFLTVEKMSPSNKKYSVQMGNDQCNTFIYWTKNLTTEEDDPRKSAMFKIVEKSQAISIHRLMDIKIKALRKLDNKCHYEGCSCFGLYTSPFESNLVEHVLTSNVLIVCVGCNIGFTHYDKFEQHLTKSECFLIRIPNTH